MTIKALIFLAAIAWLIAPPAFADGTVMRAKGCGDKVFVTTENGYSVLVASQSDVASDGDRLIGDTDKIGFASFYLPQSGRHFSASEASPSPRSRRASPQPAERRMASG